MYEMLEEEEERERRRKEEGQNQGFVHKSYKDEEDDENDF